MTTVYIIMRVLTTFGLSF